MYIKITTNLDWELIRSAHDIENEVDFVDDNDTNKDRKEYGCMDVEGGQIIDTISDEISDEINQYNFTSSTPIAPLSLSAITANEHDHETDPHISKQQQLQQMGFEIINDSTESATNKASTTSTTSSTVINNKSNKLNKSNRKRRIVSYKLRQGKRYNNRRKVYKTK